MRRESSGIRTMRRLSADADLSPPEFKSDREGDSFCVTVFLHNLLSEDDHACRDFSGMDTLTASRVLRRLRDRSLLEKHGAGNRTYYSLQPTMQTEQSMVASSQDLFTDLRPMVSEGLLKIKYPETANHLHQIYKDISTRLLRCTFLGTISP